MKSIRTLTHHDHTHIAAQVAGIMARNRAVFGTAVMVDDPETPPAEPTPVPTPPANTEKAKEYGFPPGTPVAEMTDGQRANYWQAHSRKHEDAAKALKADSDELVKLRAETATEAEKALNAARADERAKSAPRLVGAEFRAAAKGVLTNDQRDALLEDLDLTKYLTDKGEVDVEKVERKVAALAPVAPPKGMPDLGQGKRDGTPKASVAAGRDLFAERHPVKA